NEGGVGNTFRVLKNIMGLWLLRQCREAWASDRLYSYSELSEMALSAPPFKALVEPDDGSFLNPPDMPEAIRSFCRRAGQPAPETPAEFVRCVFESLALKYRLVLDQLRRIYPRPIDTIHVIGGGSRNEVLCQFTANATGVEVLAGPVEATAIGNLLVQALGLGHVSSLADIRDIVRQSSSAVRYEPERTADWDRAYERVRELQA
ncbi:MAG: FGGY-family carbohydrate kinase, partial [Armatimonadetes bacterium]|nr:FGGY-family carbohydrate kinase [Armatimonadota bacterium]